MANFILGCSFSLESHAKNVRETATKCSLKTAESLLDPDGHVFIYVWYLWWYSSSKLFQNKLLMPQFFFFLKRNVLSVIQFETHVFRRNICSIRRFFRALKNIFRPVDVSQCPGYVFAVFTLNIASTKKLRMRSILLSAIIFISATLWRKRKSEIKEVIFLTGIP